MRRARQHRIFRSHPAAAFSFEKWGNLLLHRGSTDHLGVSISIRTDPSACLVKFRVTLTGRIWSRRRPSNRITPEIALMPCPFVKIGTGL